MISGFVVGTFVYEIKNRFRCLVKINGFEEVCYVASSSRLSNYIDLCNRLVLLKPVVSAKSGIRYSVYAVKVGRRYVLLNLNEANKVVEKYIKRRSFCFLGERKHISREYYLHSYRTDLFIKDTKTLLEVKTVLSLNNKAVFPSVNSERAVRQLKAISSLLDSGYKACYLLVSLSSYVEEIEINSEQREFVCLFLECINKGMLCVGLSLGIKGTEPVICSKIKVVY